MEIVKNANDFCNIIIRKLQMIEKEVEDINGSGGKVIRDPSRMMKGPSPMYKSYQYAQEVFKNPELKEIEQHLKDVITKALKS